MASDFMRNFLKKRGVDKAELKRSKEILSDLERSERSLKYLKYPTCPPIHCLEKVKLRLS